MLVLGSERMKVKKCFLDILLPWVHGSFYGCLSRSWLLYGRLYLNEFGLDTFFSFTSHEVMTSGVQRLPVYVGYDALGSVLGMAQRSAL
jgi:hypothetical protein